MRGRPLSRLLLIVSIVLASFLHVEPSWSATSLKASKDYWEKMLQFTHTANMSFNLADDMLGKGDIDESYSLIWNMKSLLAGARAHAQATPSEFKEAKPVLVKWVSMLERRRYLYVMAIENNNNPTPEYMANLSTYVREIKQIPKDEVQISDQAHKVFSNRYSKRGGNRSHILTFEEYQPIFLKESMRQMFNTQ